MRIDELPDSGRLAGMLTSAELARIGVTKSSLRILVGRGALVSLGRGLYAKAAPVTQLNTSKVGPAALRLAAAVMAVGPDAVGSYRHAAAIHGLQLLAYPRTDVVDVTRPPAASVSRSARPGTQLHIAALPPGHRELANGIPVTSVARTVIDLARTTSVREGVSSRGLGIERQEDHQERALFSYQLLRALARDRSGAAGRRLQRRAGGIRVRVDCAGRLS
jgi:predicted transcriptional regulator of viral defense system